MVDILLAVFNGEPYLSAQMDSLIAQKTDSSFSFRILVRDDGSSDGSTEILKNYKKREPRLLELLPGGERLGLVRNFETLLTASNADYVMLCDQDDLWLPNKILDAYRRVSAMDGEQKERAVLAYSDLVVIDSSGRRLSDSKFRSCRQRPHLHDIPSTILCPVLSGCTMMLNRKMKNACLPFPPGVGMHDAWINISAAMHSAHFEFIPGEQILWREHGNNCSGGGSSFFHQKRLLFLHYKKEKQTLLSLLRASDLRAESESCSLPENIRRQVHEISELPEMNLIMRTVRIFRYSFGKLPFLTLLSRIFMCGRSE